MRRKKNYPKKKKKVVSVPESLWEKYTKNFTFVSIQPTTITKFKVFIQKTLHHQAINHSDKMYES